MSLLASGGFYRWHDRIIGQAIDKQIELMESLFGVKKFVTFPPVVVDIVYRGEKTKLNIKSAFGKIFNTELELLQPIEGENIYTEFLNQGREGFHHVAYRVDDIPLMVKKFKENDIEVIQSGKVGSLKYAYLDTEKKLGMIFELQEESKRKRTKK